MTDEEDKAVDEADPLVGKRIELLAMPDDPSPIEIGEQGTVRSVNQTSRGVQIGVDWDNGRLLMLVIPPDRYRVID